jgi:hypothetical protein
MAIKKDMLDQLLEGATRRPSFRKTGYSMS